MPADRQSTPGGSARNRYQEDGFAVFPEAVLPAELVRRATAGMDAVRAGQYDTGTPPQPSYWNPGDDPGKLCKIEMPQAANRAIRELLCCAELGELAAAVAGADWVQIWWVQLLYKPPAGPDEKTRIGWHQDRHYWKAWEEGSELFTAWIALSDVTAESGPMRFLRGSHRWGLQESDFYGQDHDDQRRKIRVPDGAAWEEVPALLPPGGVSFHHCLTYHGSSENRTSEPRRSLAAHLRSANSRPVGNAREGLTRCIDDPAYCPVIFDAESRRAGE